MRIDRDSLGRTRTERFLFGPLQAANNARRERADADPDLRSGRRLYVHVAGAEAYCASSAGEDIPGHCGGQHTAFDRGNGRKSPGSATGGTGTQRPPACEAGPEATEESLGSQLIDGIQAEGTRRTVTFAEGLIGNDRPLVRVCEKWYSLELKIVVLNKCSDTRSGETTLRIRNIERSEPDATLFQVPEDYTIEDAKDRFAMGYVGSFP